MPLSELYRMAKGKLESTREKNATCSNDLSFLPENDLFELVWENGQILKQGQSSKARKSPTRNNFQYHCLPSYTSKIRDKDIGNGSNSKMGKFGGMESVLNEIPMSVPSDEMDLSQDDDMMPWLNYPIDDSLQHEYCPEFLPELSGVTVNELSNQNNLASIDKRSSCNLVYRDCHTNSVNDVVSLGQGNVSKVSSVGVGEATRPRTTPVYPSSSQQCQTSFSSLRSRVTDGAGNNTSSVMPRAVCGDSTQVASAAAGFPTIKMQKKDQMSSNNNSNLMNFSHFSRPAALVKANLQNMGLLTGSDLSSMERITSKDKGSAASIKHPPESTHINSISGLQKESSSHCQPLAAPAPAPSKVDLKPSEDKPAEETVASKQSEAVCPDEASRNDNISNQVFSESATKGLPDGEKTTEPVVASSSVCSGNSVERASDDPTYNLKRKFRDTEESECHSEDIEEESIGAKKAASGRAGTGSKRSRAAEVHNLSERRRRDRINEKMRALQELIPNCNKVDKASMLDEAIEYLKTLQLQVQIMSMGAGFYMPPMMLPTGMQHMSAPHMAHFSPMGVGMGMGMGMGYGMGMPDMNAGPSGYPMIQVPPMQGAHFPGPPISGHTAMHGMAGSNLQMFGLPGQGLTMPMPRAPLIPLSGGPVMKSAAGLNACGVVGPVENVDSAPASSSKDPTQNVNSQAMQITGASSSMTQTSSQCPATNARFEPSSLVQNNAQVSDVVGNTAVNSANGNDLVPSKPACYD